MDTLQGKLDHFPKASRKFFCGKAANKFLGGGWSLRHQVACLRRKAVLTPSAKLGKWRGISILVSHKSVGEGGQDVTGSFLEGDPKI